MCKEGTNVLEGLMKYMDKSSRLTIEPPLLMQMPVSRPVLL